jgi:hypothetical protein
MEEEEEGDDLFHNAVIAIVSDRKPFPHLRRKRSSLALEKVAIAMFKNFVSNFQLQKVWGGE